MAGLPSISPSRTPSATDQTHMSRLSFSATFRTISSA
jgi:hypothetical protein